MAKLVIIDTARVRAEIDAPIGQSVMQIIRDKGYDIEGVCEGALACATCHMVVEQTWFDKLTPVKEDEADMLDFADDLTPTSRLSCQITMSEELDGVVLTIPSS